ncbi:MAG: hypothetical protein RSC76_05365 [Oscillospiraceae bacterium]
MMTEVLDAMTRVLHGMFPQAHIFLEEARQGVRDGDFVVGLNSFSTREIHGGVTHCRAEFFVERYQKTPDFAVLAVFPDLFGVLPLKSGIFLRGHLSECTRKGERFALKVRYEYYLQNAEEALPMEELELKN